MKLKLENYEKEKEKGLDMGGMRDMGMNVIRPTPINPFFSCLIVPSGMGMGQNFANYQGGKQPP